jgi:enterochelin esterase-like enzyme
MVMAVAIPLVVAVLWRRGRNGVWRIVRDFVSVVVCQAVAVAATGVLVNDQFQFYNSWADLFGTQNQQPVIPSTNGLVPRDGSQGSVVALSVPQSGAPHKNFRVLVWLPREYQQPQYRSTRFPVTMMLPGQPGTPQGVFRQFQFGRLATQAIEQHQVKPFVAVFSPIMVSPPRDTECTNVPGGPQAESWLYRDVRNAVIKRTRVVTSGLGWSTLGWSTGGFCAAKLLLRHPRLFHAAVGIGAYYDAETDRTTGDLFKGSFRLRNANSPIWLMQHNVRSSLERLLIVVSKQDRASYDGIKYADSRQMIGATQGMPGVSTLLLPQGGHNYHVYRAAMPQILAWLGRNAAL